MGDLPSTSHTPLAHDDSELGTPPSTPSPALNEESTYAVPAFEPEPFLPSPNSKRNPRGRSTPKSRTRRPRTNKVTFLYRYYDVDDVLLYIGITDNLADRTSDHAWSSSWMNFAVRSTIERHATRGKAERTEVEAIRAERPLFNLAHNDEPGAERRLVDYLIEHDRRDLLRVAVSRG